VEFPRFRGDGDASYSPDGGVTHISAWQQRQTVFRALSAHDFALRRPEFFSVMEGVRLDDARGENLPDQELFINALADRFSIPGDKIPEFLGIFNESIKAADLLDESGPRPRLVDVGRDEQHQQGTPGRTPRKVDASGLTCFVMQPFAGPLGEYYDTIYKPAIEQVGMQSLRADAEIFGPRKIMEQIWRGIRSAKVLVAELTTKNSNVFYELGLAHALEKPVVLVSSNQEDVPFDLRHIRVILYDQSDPFWGARS
jgi:hypothetical protein